MTTIQDTTRHPYGPLGWGGSPVARTRSLAWSIAAGRWDLQRERWLDARSPR